MTPLPALTVRSRGVDKLELLTAAYAEVERRLHLVTAEQWTLPTPCDEWDVRGLVNHIVTSYTTGTMLLHGASREETAAIIGDDLLGDDPLEAFARSAAEQANAFRLPGVLEQIVHHPALDMSGVQLLDFRIGDNAIHAWDRARDRRRPLRSPSVAASSGRTPKARALAQPGTCW